MNNDFKHGYRLAEGTDIFDFQTRLRSVLDPIRARLDAKLVGNLAAFSIDKAWAVGETPDTSPAITRVMDYWEQQSAMEETNKNRNPFGFSAIFGKDPITGRILMDVYSQACELIDALAAMEEVEEYAYWITSRVPGNLSDEEWAGRWAAWSRTWPEHGGPRYALLEFTHRDPVPELLIRLGEWGEENPDAVIIPDRENRARNLAYKKAVKYLTDSGLADKREAPHAAARGLETIIWNIAPLLPELTPEVVRKGVDGLSGAEKFQQALEGGIKAAFRYLEPSA